MEASWSTATSRFCYYLLGGKDNYAADREAAELAMAATPTIVAGVRANRRFLGRAVQYMTTAGIRQFVDIGTGIPTESNTHEVAQEAAPECRVVYVDNDRCKSGCAHEYRPNRASLHESRRIDNYLSLHDHLTPIAAKGAVKRVQAQSEAQLRPYGHISGIRPLSCVSWSIAVK